MQVYIILYTLYDEKYGSVCKCNIDKFIFFTSSRSWILPAYFTGGQMLELVATGCTVGQTQRREREMMEERERGTEKWREEEERRKDRAGERERGRREKGG